MTYRHERAPLCPSCRKPLDAATSSSAPHAPIKPKPGDLSVCAYCGELLCFDDALDLRRLSDAEILAMPESLRQTLLSLSQLLRRQRPS